jgi:TRAP-type mannitol/chloroaromatic compound transport system permease small subunit
MKKLIEIIQKISEGTGIIAGFLPIAMMCFVTYEVVSRYAFSSPSRWVWLANKQLFGLFVLLAGVYAMAAGAHIRIEILYDRFPPKLKFISRLLSLFLCGFFLICLIWQGTWMAQESLAVREKAMGIFQMPLYPLKIMIPAVSFIFLLEAIVVFFLKKDE